RDLIAAKWPWQIGVLRDHARQRNGEIESQPELLAFRIRHEKNRLLRFLPRAPRQHIEIFDRGCAERHESVKLVNASNAVDHLLPRQHLVGQEIAQSAGKAGLDGISQGRRQKAEGRKQKAEGQGHASSACCLLTSALVPGAGFEPATPRSTIWC